MVLMRSRNAAPVETLHIQFVPTQNPDQYRVEIQMPSIPLMGALVSTPPRLIPTTEIGEIREMYESQVRDFHQLEIKKMAVSADHQPLLNLGRSIANLLPQRVQEEMVRAIDHARRRGRRLRILLEATPESRQMLAIPWELLALPLSGSGHDDFLLQDAQIALVRQVRGAGRQIQPQVRPPLHVEAFVATPQGGNPIESASTYQALAQVLAPEVLATCWYAGVGTLAVMAERMRRNPQILHLLCHGEMSPTSNGQRYDLLFTHQDGFTQRVSSYDLAKFLSAAPQLQVVILQACFSGATPTMHALAEGERQAFESIALSLVRQGVPAVVAMQGKVSQVAAGAFVQALYSSLGQGESLDIAVAAGRLAMCANGAALDWSLPVLYQGSGPLDVPTWYTRLADRVDAGIRDASTRRMLRGMLVAWVLLLLLVSLSRALLIPGYAPSDLKILINPLALWFGAGVLGPAIIATCQRGILQYADPPSVNERAIRHAQWMGAYLGYALTSLVVMSLWVTLWTMGLFDLVPLEYAYVLFVLSVGFALGMSYALARSQARSALVVAELDSTLYAWGSLAVVLFAALIMLATPIILFFLSSPWPWLHQPAALAMSLGVSLLFMLALGDR